MRYPRTVTVQHRAESGRDPYGNVEVVTLSSSVTPAEVQQATTTELLLDRDTVVTDWLLLLPPAVTLGRLDRVVLDGATFEVQGDPELIVHPWTGAADHVEARIRRVEG